MHLIQTTMEADGMLICARWDIVGTTACTYCLPYATVQAALLMT